MSRRRLAGRTILVTRPDGRGDGLARALRSLGARVVVLPVIKIVPPRSYARLDAAMSRLDVYDAVVFTSRNAVERFFARARRKPKNAYAIGPATAAALKERGITARAVPKESRGEELAKVIKGKRILIPRAERAREILPRMLRKKGMKVEIVDAYRTIDDKTASPRLRSLAESGELDAVTFTSASTVRSVLRQLGAARWKQLMRRVAAASIGPITSAALRAAGATRVVQASRADESSLAAALTRALS